MQHPCQQVNMNLEIPLVCSSVLPKRDLDKYLEWQEQRKTDPNAYPPYGVHLYRVTHHLKEVPIENHPIYRAYLKYCIPEEASWIEGCGVCGIISKIEDVVLIKKQVAWPISRILEERERAISGFWMDSPWRDLKVSHGGKLMST